jgi:hypothetical protein
MMDILRVTAAYIVKESDLTKAAKLQIMNFLENEATDAQVMVLLLDGEIHVMDEMAESIVYDRWDASMLSEKGKILSKVKTFLKDPMYTKRAKKDLKNLQTSIAKYKRKPSGKGYVDTEVKVGRAKASNVRAVRRTTGAIVGGYVGGVTGISVAYCKKKFPNNPQKYKECMWGKKKAKKEKK